MLKVVGSFFVLWAVMLTFVMNSCSQHRPSYGHSNNALFLSAPDRGIEPMVLKPVVGRSKGRM